jgi:glucokinase (EC 2.7.1.2)
MKPYAFGVDLGGTTVKIGFFETNGTLVKKWEIPTRKDMGGSLILSDIAEALQQECRARKIKKEELEGIGVGVPGAVLEHHLVNKCVNLGWGVIDVAEELGKLTGIENIMVGNDANVAALGEVWQGGGKGNKNLVMVTLGTGVGGGIILGGKIVPGSFGAAGEIGHFTMSNTETMSCGCGKKGHLEQYVSATGIARKAQELLSESSRPSALRDVQYLSAREVFDCAKNGDELSLEIVEFVGDTLGKALALVACVVDPDIFLIGGGVSKAGDILLNTVQSHFRKYAFHASENVKFALATLGNDAGMYGAVKMIL